MFSFVLVFVEYFISFLSKTILNTQVRHWRNDEYLLLALDNVQGVCVHCSDAPGSTVLATRPSFVSDLNVISMNV